MLNKNRAVFEQNSALPALRAVLVSTANKILIWKGKKYKTIQKIKLGYQKHQRLPQSTDYITTTTTTTVITITRADTTRTKLQQTITSTNNSKKQQKQQHHHQQQHQEQQEQQQQQQ